MQLGYVSDQQIWAGIVGALLTAGLLAVYVVKFVRKTREMGWN